jgi:hypothetical protein
MPAIWTENALKAGADAPAPLSLEGIVTLAGVAFGFLSGLAWWVKKYGFPNVESKWFFLILRYVVGMIGVAVFYLGLKLVFPAEPLLLGLTLRFVRYGLIGLWVTVGAPLVFKKLNI